MTKNQKELLKEWDDYYSDVPKEWKRHTIKEYVDDTVYSDVVKISIKLQGIDK